MQWTETSHGTKQGRVGKVRLFTISPSISGVGYELRTDLPGIERTASKVEFETIEQAQERAERLLDFFLDYISKNN